MDNLSTDNLPVDLNTRNLALLAIIAAIIATVVIYMRHG